MKNIYEYLFRDLYFLLTTHVYGCKLIYLFIRNIFDGLRQQYLALVISHYLSSTNLSHNYKRVSETIAFYNKRKFGVDVVDQKKHKYSVKAGSFRWPLLVFFNILDFRTLDRMRDS